LRQVVPWLQQQEHLISLPGLCKLLQRLRVSYKRGRRHVHSPDLDYDKKLAVIAQAQEQCRREPGRFVFLYGDELTFFKLPRVGFGYAGTGCKGLKATGTGTQLRRIAACLDITTGAVLARQRSKFTVQEMYYFFRFVEKHYPQAERIYIAVDNWPVHFHPFVLESLQQQRSRIHLLRLPTYAPWTNPTEKVWLKLSREVLDQHPFGLDWKGLQQAIADWFALLEHGSPSLLHFVGLSP